MGCIVRGVVWEWGVCFECAKHGGVGRRGVERRGFVECSSSVLSGKRGWD